MTSVPNNVGGSTVTYGANSGTVAILSTWTYRNLVVNGSGGTFNLSSGIVVNEGLILTTGTVSTTGSNYPINVAGDVTMNGGTFSLNASTV